jgi:hypothetical protein
VAPSPSHNRAEFHGHDAPGRPASETLESRSRHGGPPPQEPGDHGGGRGGAGGPPQGADRIARRPGGLSEDEAFLVAVKRMGAVDALTREFAREHSDRLWKQLVLSGNGAERGTVSDASGGSRRMWVALALAVAAGVAIKLPRSSGSRLRRRPEPLLPAQPRASSRSRSSWRTSPGTAAAPARPWMWLAAAFVLSAARGERLPVRCVRGRYGDPHHPSTCPSRSGWRWAWRTWEGGGGGASGGWTSSASRGALHLLRAHRAGRRGAHRPDLRLFQAIGIDPETLVSDWILPSAPRAPRWSRRGSWKRSRASSRTWRPSWPGSSSALRAPPPRLRGDDGGDRAGDRRRARDPHRAWTCCWWWSSACSSTRSRPATRWRLRELFDWLHLTLVGTALVVDLVALWAIGARISDFGWTPNRSRRWG